jgi:hypothetical protein
MKQFLIVGWKGKAASARGGAKWVLLPDSELDYEKVRADFQEITASGLHDEFDMVELVALDSAVKSRKLITQAEVDRRKKSIAEQEKKAADLKSVRSQGTGLQPSTLNPQPSAPQPSKPAPAPAKPLITKSAPAPSKKH